MKNCLIADYNTKKIMSLFVLNNRLIDISDFLEKGNNSSNYVIEGIENDEYDEDALLEFCFKEERNKEIDKETIEMLDNLGLSYFIYYNDGSNDFHVYSTDGTFESNFESAEINDGQCTGIFEKYLNKSHDFIINDITNNIPIDGEYDVIIKCI